MRRFFFSSGKNRGKLPGAGTLRPYLLSSVIPVLFLAVVVALSLGAVVRGGDSPGAYAAAGDSGGSSGMDRGLGGRLAPSGDYPRPRVTYSAQGLAASVDLSGQLPPIGNQGNQNSCVAWASGYYYKSWSEGRKHADPAWDLSDPWYQYSPSFIYNQRSNRSVDNGMSFPEAFDLLQDKGDTDIAYMPYDPSDWTTQPNSKQLNAALPYRISPTWGSFWTRYWAPFSGFMTPTTSTTSRPGWTAARSWLCSFPFMRIFQTTTVTCPPNTTSMTGHRRWTAATV